MSLRRAEGRAKHESCERSEQRSAAVKYFTGGPAYFSVLLGLGRGAGSHARVNEKSGMSPRPLKRLSYSDGMFSVGMNYKP